MQEQTAKDWSCGDGYSTGHCPQSDSTCALIRLVGESLVKNRQGTGDHGGGADALQGAKSDEAARAPCQSATSGCQSEEHQSGLENAFGPQPVADTSGRQHESGKGYRVSIRYPLQRADAGGKCVGNAGQGDIDDGYVQLGNDERETGSAYDISE